MRRPWIRYLLWAVIAALALLRLFSLRADFPDYTAWMIDQAKYTDEGWWGQAATMHQLTGHWSVAGDYNPAAALPVWPTLLGVAFHLWGVSLLAARALAAGLSLGSLGLVYLLMRRYGGDDAEWNAILATLLAASSPFVFIFSRLAILDSLMIFEFCLLLLLASTARMGRLWPMAAMTVMVTTLLLTKTTAAVLLPAAIWLAWTAMGSTRGAFLRTLAAIVVLPAILLKAYEGLVVRLGHGADYHYFFDVNRMSDMDWSESFPAIWKVLHDCLWIDRILYPASLAILIFATIWARRLWKNPLFAASWIAVLGEAVYLVRRTDDYAPRYLLVMVIPVVFAVVLGTGELRRLGRGWYGSAMLVILVTAIGNMATIGSYVAHREFRFYNAAASIRKIVEGDPGQNRMLLGVSGSQLSLMMGMPSINDVYGTMSLKDKAAIYNPGWYIAWNGIGAPERAALANYRMEEVAAYPLFDDDERNLLVLYRMERVDATAP